MNISNLIDEIVELDKKIKYEAELWCELDDSREADENTLDAIDAIIDEHSNRETELCKKLATVIVKHFTGYELDVVDPTMAKEYA